MRVEDITIQVRSLALGNVGEIDKGYINDLKIVKRFKNVGSWSFSLPAEYDMAAELSQPGRGIKITGPGWVVSGPMISTSHKNSSDDVQGTLYFVGSDDMIHLADALAFPQPSNSDVSTQNVAYDVRTGNGETLLRSYLDANRGPSAPSDRRISTVALQTNSNRGGTVTSRARFDVLGQLMSDIALQAGGLGVDMVQVNTQIQLAVYQPQDKSATIRMDINNDMLTSSEYGYGSPTATRAIVAGQGDLVDRKFLEVTSVDSLAAETQWGRKIEFFKDRRDTNDTTEMTQDGQGIVGANGVTIKSLSVSPADDIANQEFGEDWFLGDQVAVVVDGQPLTSVVTEAVILMDESGVRVGATLGDPIGFDYDAKLVAAQQSQDARISALEKNVEPIVAATTALVAAGTDPYAFITSLGLAIVLPVMVADVAALPTASSFREGTHIHVDALNVDFVQKDGVWVQDGIASVANVSDRNTEYAKASAAYRVAGAQVRVVGIGLTYEYYTTAIGAVANAWYPVIGIFPSLERIISANVTSDGTNRTLDWNTAGAFAKNIISGTDGTIELSSGTFTVRQPGRWRITSALTWISGSSYTHQDFYKNGTQVRRHQAVMTTSSFTTNVLVYEDVFAAGNTFRIDHNAGASLQIVKTDGSDNTHIIVEYMGPG